jgi:hypothetical protein
MIKELLIGGIICILLMLSGVHIIASIQMYTINEVAYQATKPSRVYPRRIPVCDKPTWERVRHGCG